MTPAARSGRRRWPVPTALIALALLPVVAGAARLVELSGGGAVLPEPHAVEASLPLALHIVSAVVFTVLGAFQFVPGTRGRRPAWHRITGRIVAPAGLVAALSGLWLTLVITDADPGLLTVFRTAAGAGMGAAIVLGVLAVLRRDIRAHRAWMLRGYALGIAAGTQVFTAGLGSAVVGDPEGTTLALLMGAGWVINLAVAEWLIRRRPSRSRAAAGRSVPVARVTEEVR